MLRLHSFCAPGMSSGPVVRVTLTPVPQERFGVTTAEGRGDVLRILFCYCSMSFVLLPFKWYTQYKGIFSFICDCFKH